MNSTLRDGAATVHPHTSTNFSSDIEQTTSWRERSNFFKTLVENGPSVDALIKGLTYEQASTPRFELEYGLSNSSEPSTPHDSTDDIFNMHGRMLKTFKDGTQEDVMEETRFGLVLEDECLTLLSAELQRQNQVEAWARFDLTFGLIVLLNALFLGAVVQGHLEETSFVTRAAEGAFFFCYVIEFGLRVYYSGHWRKVLSDSWLMFDVLVLVMTALDVVLVGLLSASTDTGSGANSLAIVRLVRVLRAFRLMRLLRLVGQFWLLIRGMLDSMAFVSWAVLMMVLASYLFGIFIFEVIKGAEGDMVLTEYWGSVASCLATMLQISTFDGAFLIRYLINMDYVDSWILFVFLLFLVFCTIGMINVIIGVLVNTSIELALRDQQLEAIHTRYVNRQHLRVLRMALQAHFARRGTGTTVAVLSRQSVFALCFDDVPLEDCPPAESNHRPSIADIMNKSWQGKSFAELFALAKVTERDANVIFNALEGAVGGSVSLSIDDFIERCIWLKEDVHPLEIFNLSNGLLTNLKKLRRMDDSLTIALHALDDTLNEVEPLLSKYHSRQAVKDSSQRENLARSLADKYAMSDRRLGLKQAARDQEAAALAAAHRLELETDLLGKVDQLFALILLANSISIGVELGTRDGTVQDMDVIQTLTPSIELMWWLMEVLFLVAYTAELWIRVCLYYQIRVLNSYKVSMGIFPSIMYRMPIGEAWEVIKYSKKALRENRHLAFDAFTILIAVADTLILPWTPHAENATVLQAARLARAIRFGRIPHIMTELQLINSGMTDSLPLLAWSIFLLFAIVYACAIVMVEAIGMSGRLSHNPALQEAWSDLGNVILSLIECVAYSPKPLMEIAEYVPWMYIFAPIFITATTVGLMNLVTGMMIVSSYRITAGKRLAQLEERLMLAKEQIHAAAKRVFDKSNAALKKQHKDIHANIDLMREVVASNAAVGSKYVHSISIESDDHGVAARPSTHTAPEEHHEEEHVLGVSSNNKDESCTVLHVLWLSSSEIALDFRIAGAGEGPPPWPGEPILTWNGGSQAPEELAQVGEDGKGRFVWKALPQVSKFTFSFGNGYSSVKIRPDHPIKHLSHAEISMLTQERQNHISSRNLGALMKDATLVKELRKAGLRPDQAFLVFQKLLLDEVGGSVSVDDFVQALARIRLPVQGIDIASAKNLLRRAVMESKTLTDNVQQSREGWGHLVERLRDVRFVDMSADNKASDVMASASLPGAWDDMNGMDVETSCMVLERQNHLLRGKIKVLRRYDKERRARMRANGDFGVRKVFYEDGDLLLELERHENKKLTKQGDKSPKSPGQMLKGGSGPSTPISAKPTARTPSPAKQATVDPDAKGAKQVTEGADANEASSDSSWSDDESIHSVVPGYE